MKALRKRWPEGTWMRLTDGRILRALMDAKHLSNEDIARHSGVGRTFISALVNERRTSCTPKVAELIADRLQVPLEVIFVPRASAASGRSVKTAQTREKVA